MKRSLLILAMALPLQGCFFIAVPIPGTAIDGFHDAMTGERGENCVGGNIKVGDKVNMPGGGRGTVTALSGKSTRCVETDKPVRATIVAGV